MAPTRAAASEVWLPRIPFWLSGLKFWSLANRLPSHSGDSVSRQSRSTVVPPQAGATH
jgi:hypothetical protein